MDGTDTTVVERFYEAFERGDLDELLSTIDPEVEWSTPKTLPWSRGAYRGRAGLTEYLANFGAALTDAHIEPHEVHSLPGGRVIALGVERARARRTGVAFVAPFAHVWTLRDGRVTGMRGLNDTAAIAKAFRR